MKIVYLAGPINACSDAEAISWREAVIGALSSAVQDRQVEFLDPMRRDYRGREDQAVSEIVEGDKIDIDQCDIFLANCWKPSVGTSMEIYYAWLKKTVPIIAIVGEKPSPWLTYHCHRLVPTTEEAIKSLWKVL